MKCNLPPRCFKQESGVPRSSVRSIETASQGTRVRECGVHNVGVRKPEHEVMHREPGQKRGLSGQALIGSALQFKQGGQFSRIRRQSVQYALLLEGGRDQSMSVVLKNPRNRWNQLPPTPARIEQLSHSQHGRHAALDQICHGRVPFKHRVGIRQLHPTIGKALRIEDIQRLENAGQQRDSRQAILVDHSRAFLFKLVICPVRNTAQQLPGVFVSELPKPRDFQECLHSRRAQPSCDILIREVSGPAPSRRHQRPSRHSKPSLCTPTMEDYTSNTGLTQRKAYPCPATDDQTRPLATKRYSSAGPSFFTNLRMQSCG